MSGGDSAPSASMSTGGGGGGPTPLDQRVTLASIKDDGLGMKEKPDYISIKGTVTYIRHENEPWYTACPNLTCNRKVNFALISDITNIQVVEGFNQQWTCEKCNQEFPNVLQSSFYLFIYFQVCSAIHPFNDNVRSFRPVVVQYVQ